MSVKMGTTNIGGVRISKPNAWTIDDIEGGAPDGAIISTNTSVRNRAYDGSSITSYTNENVTSLNTAVFEQCQSLTKVWLPSLNTLNTLVFNNCVSIQSVALPSLTTISSYNNFQSCTSLTIADFGGQLSRVRTYTFNACSALRYLILRRTDAVVPLEIWSANCMGGIYSNPASSTIYVPRSLITQYQQATNWVTAYSAGLTFASIEGSQYENYYADGTPISTS